MKCFKQLTWEIYLGLLAALFLLLRAFSIFAEFYFLWDWRVLLPLAIIPLFLPQIAAILLIAMTIIRIKKLSPMQWVLRLFILAGLIGGVYWHTHLQIQRISDLGTRARVSSKIDLNKLQAWAVRVIREHKEDSPPLFDGSKQDPQQRYSKEVVPEIIKLEPRLRISERDGNEKCIWISWGGGFHYWAVVVGSPTFKMERDQSFLDIQDRDLISRWQDGIYGYQER